jgi:xylulokinase
MGSGRREAVAGTAAGESREVVVPSAPEAFVLAVDLGTSSCKVDLISERGDVAGREAEPVPLRLVEGGGAEQDPEAWWGAIVRSARRLIDRRLVPVDSIIAVCAAAHGLGTVPVDAAGQPLAPAMIWLDARGSGHAQRATGGFPSIEGYQLAKLLRWIRLTGGAPSLSGKDPFGHMLFLQRERPEIYRAAHRFLDVIGYLDFRLTGRVIATWDTAAFTWLTDNRDPRDIRYDPGLARLAGLDLEQQPPLVPCTEVLGPLLPEVADELGLKRDVRVVAGCFDLPAVALGSGAVEDYAAHLSVATSSFLTVHLPYKKTDVAHAMASMPCALPDRYLLMAEQEIAGGCLTFLRDQLLFPADALGETAAPEDFFPRLNRLAEGAPAGSGGIVFLPWLYGERAPVDDPALRGMFFNLSMGSTRADLVRSVLEGVAFNTRWILGPVERFCGRRIDPIRIAGGGAQSDLWCQIFADVLGRTILQTEGPAHATARGAAFIALMGLQRLQPSDIPGLVRIRRTYTPEPAAQKVYGSGYGTFLELYRRTRGVFHKANEGLST